MKYIDLSHTIVDHLSVYPGDEEVQLQKTKSFITDGYHNSRLQISMHIGTHIDGPMHLTTNNQFISEMDLTRLIGRGFLIDARGVTQIEMNDRYQDIQEGDIVLIYTGFDQLFGSEDYYEQHPIITEVLANFLINKKVNMIGLDFPSPDRFPYTVHKQLLENGILIIENMIHLDRLINKNFEIIALPIKVAADSAPARVIAKIKD